MHVIAFAGRRVDAPDAAVPRLPPAASAAIREQLRHLFAERLAEALVCSAACGADLLALEAAAALGMRQRIVLPFARDRFRVTSVTDRADPTTDWGARYDEALDAAAPGDVVVLNGASGHDAYVAAGLAVLDEAARLAGDAGVVRAVVVWEGQPRGEGDLTAAFAAEARARGWPVEEILTHPTER